MSRGKEIRIIIAIISISFIQGLQFCVTPILGSIQEHYPQAGLSMIQMLVTAPTLLAMAVAIVSGWLVMKISKKKLLIIAGFLAGVTGFLPFLGDSFGLLFLSRILYGLALGLAMTLNTAVVAEFFEGERRTAVMGIQAASVGMGMVVVTTCSGFLGTFGFRNAYFVNIIGFAAMLLIFLCLPDTGVVKISKQEPIKMNKNVWLVTLAGFFEMMFLITFSTNIAMHISGELAGSTTVSGNLIGAYSAAQIGIGLLLGMITKLTGKYTLPTAMLCFSVGGLLLILYPANYLMLMAGALMCGFSQGIFIPTAMVAVSNAVTSSAVAMAAACLTCGNALGQLLSPLVLNSVSEAILGETTTTNVYKAAVVGMTITAMIMILVKRFQKEG